MGRSNRKNIWRGLFSGARSSQEEIHFDQGSVGPADPDLVDQFSDFHRDSLRVSGLVSLADMPIGDYATDIKGRRYRKVGTTEDGAVLEGADGTLRQQSTQTILRRSIAPEDFDPNRSALYSAAQQMRSVAEGAAGKKARRALSFLNSVKIPDDFSNQSELERQIRVIRDALGSGGVEPSSEMAQDIEEGITKIFRSYTNELERNPGYISDAELAQRKGGSSNKTPREDNAASEELPGLEEQKAALRGVDWEYEEAIRREADYFRDHPDEWTN